MTRIPPHRPARLPVACGITGHALVEARLTEIAALRDSPGPPGAPALPARFLRHCDEHSVVGLHAVLRVLADRGPGIGHVDRHAVIAASCQIGRLAAARTLAGLAAGGGVSVSTHIVPQCSLHSVAGAVSVGLGMHGPHFGVGGGTDAFAEGLFAAATLFVSPLAAGAPPCVWLVATEWDAEPVLDDAAAPAGDPVCRALALAIEPAAVGLRLSIDGVPAGPRTAPARASGGLVEFARALAMCQAGAALVSWAVDCPWGAAIRVSQRAATAPRLQEAA